MTVLVKWKQIAFSQISVYVLTEVCHFANNLGILLIDCGVWIVVIIFWQKELCFQNCVLTIEKNCKSRPLLTSFSCFLNSPDPLGCFTSVVSIQHFLFPSPILCVCITQPLFHFHVLSDLFTFLSFTLEPDQEHLYLCPVLSGFRLMSVRIWGAFYKRLVQDWVTSGPFVWTLSKSFHYHLKLKW